MDRLTLARMLLVAAALAALPAMAAGPAAPAGYATPDPTVRWHCHYQREPEQAIACLLVTPSLEDDEALVPDLPRASVKLAAARGIRGPILSLEDTMIMIPLYSPPLDMGRVERLARAVMCRSRPACAVYFEPVRP